MCCLYFEYCVSVYHNQIANLKVLQTGSECNTVGHAGVQDQTSGAASRSPPILFHQYIQSFWLNILSCISRYYFWGMLKFLSGIVYWCSCIPNSQISIYVLFWLIYQFIESSLLYLSMSCIQSSMTSKDSLLNILVTIYHGVVHPLLKTQQQWLKHLLRRFWSQFSHLWTKLYELLRAFPCWG